MLPNSPPPGYAAPLAAEDHPDLLRGDPDYMLTLARLHVIRAFGTRRHPQTAAELSRRAGLPRAVVQRCLHTLILLGIAERQGRLYVLTPRILGLGYAYFSSTPLVSLAQPVLEELSSTINETCALAIMEGHEMLYLARSEVHRLLATSMGLGSRLPAYCTSIGRALLAHPSRRWRAISPPWTCVVIPNSRWSTKRSFARNWCAAMNRTTPWWTRNWY